MPGVRIHARFRTRGFPKSGVAHLSEGSQTAPVNSGSRLTGRNGTAPVRTLQGDGLAGAGERRMQDSLPAGRLRLPLYMLATIGIAVLIAVIVAGLGNLKLLVVIPEEELFAGARGILARPGRGRRNIIAGR